MNLVEKYKPIRYRKPDMPFMCQFNKSVVTGSLIFTDDFRIEQELRKMNPNEHSLLVRHTDEFNLSSTRSLREFTIHSGFYDIRRLILIISSHIHTEWDSVQILFGKKIVRIIFSISYENYDHAQIYLMHSSMLQY